MGSLQPATPVAALLRPPCRRPGHPCEVKQAMPERMRIVRYLNLLSLLSGIGLGFVFAAAPGCAPECAEEDYTECTSQPGLR